MSDFKEDNSYNTILKRISALGGVQVFNILANLLRGKFAAIFLGTSGIGISSLLNSAALALQQFAGLGLNLSMVKEVAASKEDPRRHAEVLSISVRLIWFTALLGAAVCIILSPFLSEWTFGNRDYTLSFVLLSIGVLFAIAELGYLSLLQGLSEVKRLSKASLVGSLTGLFCGVPLYYFYGNRGIVPAIVLIYMSLFIFYYINYRKAAKYKPVKFSWREHNPLVRRLVTLGIIFMAGGLANTLTGYLVNLFVRYIGSLDDVGLFQAASSLTNQYIAIVFSALAMDYFPRLSAISDNVEKMREVANRQTEIVILITAPLIMLLVCFAPLIIRILLTKEFLPVLPLVRWLSFGILLQAIDFPLGYYFLAKGHKKGYFWLEIVGASLLWLIFSTLFYYLWGLIGLGVSLVARTAINVSLSYAVCRRLFSFEYAKRTLSVMATCVALGLFGFLMSLIDNSMTATILMWATTAVSITISLILLKRRLKFKL